MLVVAVARGLRSAGPWCATMHPATPRSGGYEELDGLNWCKSSRQSYAPSRQLYRHITGRVALWHLPRLPHSNAKTSMAVFRAF
jgi:hypothetical protein